MEPNHQSQQFSSSSPPVTQMHNFMQMPPSHIVSHYQAQQEVGGEELESGFMQQQRQNLHLFWHQQMLDVLHNSEFKQHLLPLARVKRIMKLDKEVKMISADTPILFSKACELFILELTVRSWMHTAENRRRTLQRIDIANAVNYGEVLDFLLDVIPMEEPKDEEAGNNLGVVESHLNSGLHYPPMDANRFQTLHAEFMMRQQGTPQQFIIEPPMNSSDHNNESPPPQ